MWRLCESIHVCGVSILHVGMHGVFAPQAEGLSVCQFRGCVAFCICNVGWLSLYREMCMARACFGAGCLRVDRCGVCGCAIYR